MLGTILAPAVGILVVVAVLAGRNTTTIDQFFLQRGESMAQGAQH